jgi:hypothetical protein
MERTRAGIAVLVHIIQIVSARTIIADERAPR